MTDGASGELPRVALLFMTRGPMPMEPVWRRMFEEASKARIAPPSPAEWRFVMQQGRTARVRQRLLDAGQYEPQLALQEAACVDNRQIRVRVCHCACCGGP